MMTRLENLPVELLYDVQLNALSDTLPHVSRRLYRVFKAAPVSFHAEYILGRALAGSPAQFVTTALRHPLCTAEVFDALCRRADSASLRAGVPELPRRLFRHLPAGSRGSEWTEHDLPLPFLRYLCSHPAIEAPAVAYKSFALAKAAEACFLPLISFLLDHCTTGEKPPLLWAAGEGHEAVVKLLLAQDDIGADAEDAFGQTPLSWAAAGGHAGVTKLLLARDHIDVNSQDLIGASPLSQAASNGHEQVVELLLARDDIVVNRKDMSGGTPLSLAATHGHERVVQLLLAREDIDVNAMDMDGGTPLSWAAITGHEQVVKLLLAREDIDVNVMDAYARTPLSMAAKNGYARVVKLLLAREDINVNAQDADGHTTLWWVECTDEGVVKLLKSRDDIRLY